MATVISSDATKKDQTIIAHSINEKLRTSDIFTKDDCTFDSMLLSGPVLHGLTDAGFYKPSPIQLKAIPLGKCGLDLVIKSKSGTGKTLVFSIVALEMVQVAIKAPQVLIIAPTREVAHQICTVIKTIGKDVHGLSVCLFIGGLPYKEDVNNARNCHIAVGAPGRIQHLVEAKKLNISSVKLFILDEADKLMEEDFQSNINYLYQQLPEQKQFLAVSATVPDDLHTYLKRYMNSPSFITPDTNAPLLLGLRQFVTFVDEKSNVVMQMNAKVDELCRLLSEISFTQCIVFCNYHQRAESISNILNQRGWNSIYISAACSQDTRLKVVSQLKNFKCKILLTTNLTARGIDASNIDLVINYDIPYDTETYLHRIGRSGRYGSLGVCVSIIASEKELTEFKYILGDIGGLELGVAKLPSKIVQDVWKDDMNSFEQIYGLINNEREKVNWNCLELNENSKRTTKKSKLVKKAVKKHDGLKIDDVSHDVMFSGFSSVDLLKKLAEGVKLTQDSNEITLTPESSIEIDDSQSSNYVPKRIKNVELCPEDIEMSSEDICTNLTIGKMFNSCVDEYSGKSAGELLPWVPVDEPLLSKVGGKNLFLSDDSDCSEEVSIPNEILNKKLTLSKNLAMYNIGKIIKSDDWDTSVIKDAVKPIGDYLGVCQEKRDLTLSKLEVLSKDVPNQELCEQISYYSEQLTGPTNKGCSSNENICKVAYDYIIGGKKNWRSIVENDYAKKKEISRHTEVDTEVTNESKICDYQEDTYEENAVEQFNDNAKFNNYYNYYDNVLTETALSFEDVDSFKNWFEQWQIQVKSVTNYVQQNLYLEEMNNYNYYNNYHY